VRRWPRAQPRQWLDDDVPETAHSVGLRARMLRKMIQEAKRGEFRKFDLGRRECDSYVLAAI
jgi:hypothetical protein